MPIQSFEEFLNEASMNETFSGPNMVKPLENLIELLHRFSDRGRKNKAMDQHIQWLTS